MSHIFDRFIAWGAGSYAFYLLIDKIYSVLTRKTVKYRITKLEETLLARMSEFEQRNEKKFNDLILVLLNRKN
jgi:hypothetical protein